MIRAAVATDIHNLFLRDEALVKIQAAAAVYGTDRPFCRFWVGEGGGALMVSEGVATVSPAEDLEDMVLFLTMLSEVTTVRTDAVTARLLAKRWGVPATTGEVLCAKQTISLCGNAQEVMPQTVYPLLAQVFSQDLPPFDVWYADVHHRWRHGAFRAAAVLQEDRVVSCALTTAVCDSAVLLGAVATHPEARGKGFASACVTALATYWQQQGKCVWISPKHPAAADLYRRLGFSSAGTWGTVHK